MKEYKKILGNNHYLQNDIALSILIDKGREKLLNNNIYNEMATYIRNNPNEFMTLDFQLECLKIAKDMANMRKNDLYDFIKSEIKVLKNKDMER